MLLQRALVRQLLPVAATSLLVLPTTAQSTGGVGGGGGGGGPTSADGGSYRGPGDTVPGPRGGSAPGAGGVGRPVPSAPGAAPTPTVVRPRIPPPGAPGSPWSTPDETPNGRPVIQDETSWQHWWHHNRWAYLDVDQGLVGRVATGSGGFFLGRGSTDDGNEALRASDADRSQLVAPALTRVVAEADAPELVSQALLALGKLRGIEVHAGTKDFWQVAPRHLRHANQTVVERAVLALGVRGDERYLRWLESILANEPDGQARLGGGGVPARVRAFAAYGLGLLGERSRDPLVRVRVHSALSRALHGDEQDLRGAALVAIGHVPLSWQPLDADALPSLLAGARSRADQIAEVLAFLRDAEGDERIQSLAPETLVRLAQGAPEELRRELQAGLLELVDEQSRASRELQNGAVLALGALATAGEPEVDRRAREELTRIATRSGHHRLTRYLACIALAQVAARPGAGEAPYEGLPEARRVLFRLVEHSRGQTLCWSAIAIGILERDAALRGEMPSPEITGALRKMLERNRTAEVAGAAAIALGLIRDVEAEPVLFERMLETGEAHVRGYTALALGMIGARHAVPGVQRVLAEAAQQPFALQQAGIGLGLLGDQTTSAVLFEMLVDAKNPEIQASVAAALGWLRDPRPLGSLTARLEDQELGAASRAWTAVALGRICDRDPWPWVGRWSVGTNYDARLASLIDEDFQSGLLDLP